MKHYIFEDSMLLIPKNIIHNILLDVIRDLLNFAQAIRASKAMNLAA